MKKFLSLFIFAALFSFAASCSSSNTPSAVAEEITECFKSGDYEALDNLIYADENDEEAQQAKAMVIGMIQGKGKAAIDKHKGITSYKVLSETISEDGNSAEVKVEVTYGDGEVDTNDYDMVKVDGKWYTTVKK